MSDSQQYSYNLFWSRIHKISMIKSLKIDNIELRVLFKAKINDDISHILDHKRFTGYHCESGMPLKKNHLKLRQQFLKRKKMVAYILYFDNDGWRRSRFANS